MISAEQRAEIRRLFFAEHWKVGTIAAELGVHPDTVRRAIDVESFKWGKQRRSSNGVTGPYLDFIRETLKHYPRLRATRIYEMIRARGYTGSVVQLRRAVRKLRPRTREAFLELRTFPGEQGQVDWAHFGTVPVGRARRRLSCFVMVLSHSRAMYLEFFFSQSLEDFLRGHVRGFSFFEGVPRVLLYDNLRSVVLERRRDAIRFHPRLLELCGHYHFQARPCRPARGN
ncbi:MAG: IS21 family transposase, partial [Acidobacteriota bacterium]|nr:IS21 family transposase [Acidobacteriota bacterium]